MITWKKSAIWEDVQIVVGTMEQVLELIGTSVETCKSWFMKYYCWEDVADGMGKMGVRKVEKYDRMFTIL